MPNGISACHVCICGYVSAKITMVPSVEHTQFLNGKNISFELSQVQLASNIENLSGGNHGIYILHLCILVPMQDPNHLQQQKTQ